MSNTNQQQQQLQRKFKSQIERASIKADVYEGLVKMQILDHPAVKPLLDALELFATLSNARQFDGTIFFNKEGFKIEYMLPGRRVLRHFVRTMRLDAEAETENEIDK